MDDKSQASLIFLAVLFFFMGFALTDYGATMRVSGGHGESLVVPDIPPRVVYHLGLLSAVVGFFVQYTVAVTYVVHGDRSEEDAKTLPSPRHRRTSQT
jgi:hypothetical protein